MAIETYPDFTPLRLAHRDALEIHLRADPPGTSEFALLNLFGWRRRYRFAVARWPRNDALLLRAEARARPEYLPPVGRGDKASLIADVLAREPGARFIRVPAASARPLLAHPNIRGEADRDNADYLYSTRDLVDLKGRRYDGKRNHIKRFHAEHDARYVDIGPAERSEAWALEEAWCAARDCDGSESLRHERDAVRFMLDHFASFPLSGGALRVSDRLVALILAEPLNPDTLLIHTFKALPDFTGAAPAVYREFLARRGGGFTYVNMEQDLGLPGLRRSKLSYHPREIRKKFTLAAA